MGAPGVVVLSGLDRSPDQLAALAAVSVGEFGGHHALPIAVVVNRAEPDSLEAIRDVVSARVPGPLVAAIPENPVILAPTVQELKDAVGGTLLQGNPEWLDRVAVGTVIPLVLMAFMASYSLVRGTRRVFSPMRSLFLLGLAIPVQATIVPI